MGELRVTGLNNQNPLFLKKNAKIFFETQNTDPHADFKSVFNFIGNFELYN